MSPELLDSTALQWVMIVLLVTVFGGSILALASAYSSIEHAREETKRRTREKTKRRHASIRALVQAAANGAR